MPPVASRNTEDFFDDMTGTLWAWATRTRVRCGHCGWAGTEMLPIRDGTLARCTECGATATRVRP